MLSENYSYAERPAALILGRRGFLKVSGLCIGAAVVCGWAIGDMVARRNSIILARQAGLYEDDQLCQKMGLTASHQNQVVMSVYKDLKTKPVDHTMHELLHTHYYPRSMLAQITEGAHV
ncbi:iron hydrogenase small subunit [Sutterella sp.]|uniref:iron hydrogenase small subunit n=1 Tax=Sutterella sp. TaxID=1981025 RepID=UPI0026DF5487|nr:iron hydrogenase small subunit [Sutterella sp.]MDO5530377.1 iron hydrogenase small subunit [Sutterella sp.]